MMRSLSAVLAVLLLGWIWIAVLGTGPFERTELELCPALGETDEYDLHTSWWPPSSTRCSVQRAGGAVAVRTTTPWDAWVLVLACAAAAGALWSRHRILARLAVAAALALAGLVAFFLGLP